MKTPNSPNLFLSRRWHYLHLTLLVAQPTIFFWSVLFRKTRYIPFDIGAWHLPLASFVARCAREHILPFWDPYSNCGTAIWADIQAQLFYPLTWPALMLGNLSNGRNLLYWLQALIPLHMALAGLLLYFFVRRLGCSSPVALLAGTTYQLGPFFASQAQHLGAICGGAWFPLILLCVLELSRRVTARWIGLTAVAVSLNVLSGFPPGSAVALSSAALFGCTLLVFRISGWRLLPAFLSGVAIASCICAVQLIPSAQASNLTIAKLRADWNVNGGGLPVQSLVSFVWPNFYHIFTPFDRNRYVLPYNFTVLYTYSGYLAALLFLTTPVLLFIHRRRVYALRFLLLSFVLAVLGAVWMIGEATPIYRWVYHALPRIIRGSLYAEYALMAFSLWIAVTAALSLRALDMRWPNAAAWLAALATAVNLIVVSSNRPMNALDGGYRTRNSEYTLDGNRAPVETLQELVRSASPPLRIDFFNPVFWPFNTGAKMYRVPSAIGDNPLMNLRYYYFRLSFSGAPYWDRMQFLTNVKSPWIDAINDGFLIGENGHSPNLPADHFEHTTWIGLDVWRNRAVLPRFHLVDRVRRASSMEEARALLPSIIDPSSEAIVENLRPDWVGSGSAGSSVRVVIYDHNRLQLLVHATGPSFLVTSEAFYPGWKAAVNGHPADLLPTNLAFRGLPVPAGDSRVTMIFRPDYLVLSIALSIVGAIICICLLTPHPRQRIGPRAKAA